MIFPCVGSSKSYPGSIPNGQKMLFIEDFYSRLSGYSGGYAQNDPDPEKMDSVVSVFLEKAFAIDATDNKSNYNYIVPFIAVVYLSEDYVNAMKYYSAIARGYILFQRKNSVALFNRPIDSLNNRQMKQLTDSMPLVVKIYRRQLNRVQ